MDAVVPHSQDLYRILHENLVDKTFIATPTGIQASINIILSISH